MSTEVSKSISDIVGGLAAIGLAGWALSYLSQRVYPLPWWDATLVVFVVQFCFGGKKK